MKETSQSRGLACKEKGTFEKAQKRDRRGAERALGRRFRNG